MGDHSDSTARTRETRLNESIARYLSSQSSSEALDLAAELAANPDLCEEFNAFLARHRWLARVHTPTTTFEASPPSEDDEERAHAHLIGRTLGDCRIIRLLGRGGMGFVYLAEHLRVKDPRAVKVLPRSRVTDLAVKRFWREAQSAARINHLNVVAIHDVGQHDDVHYIVMQYVDGRTLVELLQLHAQKNGGRPLSWLHAVQLITSVLEALASVHASGLIHRDIKPSNVMVTGAVSRKLHVMLMDFGLVHDEEDANVTESGAVVGTPAFMSCEQARGLSIDRRSDVYSVGATLYFLLTGQAPFTGKKTDIYLRVAAGERPPPASNFRPDLPPRLMSILQKAMEPDRERRYASAEEMLNDFGVLRRERAVQPAPVITTAAANQPPAGVLPRGPVVEPAIATSAAPRPLPRSGNQQRLLGPLPTKPLASASATVLEDFRTSAALHETDPSVDTLADRLTDVALFELVYPPPSTVPTRNIATAKVAQNADWSTELQEWLSRRWWAAWAIAAAALVILGAIVVATYPSSQKPPPQRIVTPLVSPDPEGMVFIPAGLVHVGASENQIRVYAETIEHFRDDPETVDELIELCADQPPQTVTIDGFWIDKYEVTNGEYAKFVADTGHPPPRRWKSHRPLRGTENHPVTDVTSDDAQAYAVWAGKKLPSEAQWVRAYRGETMTMFPWGDEWDATVANTSENDAFESGTSPVDASPEDRSAHGVYNMVGNATELTRDHLRVDGQMVCVGKGANTHGLGMYYALAPARIYLAQDVSHEFIGFRCVKEAAR